MTQPDYDDPEVEAAWFRKSRTQVSDYLHRQKVPSRVLPEQPAWSVAPHVALWRVPGPRTGQPAFWAIEGDLPADFFPFDLAKDAQEALRAFGERWTTVSNYLLAGRQHPTIHIANPEQPEAFGTLLAARASLLLRWARDPDLW
jgi:hypothetical protein